MHIKVPRCMNKFSHFSQAIDILTNIHETEICIPEWKRFNTSNIILHLTDLQKLTLQYISDQDYWAPKSLANQEASFISKFFYSAALCVTPESSLSRDRCLFHLLYRDVVLMFFSVSVSCWRLLAPLPDTSQMSKEPTRTPATAATMTAQ